MWYTSKSRELIIILLKIATVRPFLFSIGIGLCTAKIVNALLHSSSESQNLCRWQVLCKLDDKLPYPLMIVEVQYFSSKLGFKQASKFPQFPSKSSFKVVYAYTKVLK